MPRPPSALPATAPVIRVVHPCGSLGRFRARVAEGVGHLSAEGCVVQWDAHAASRNARGYLAGTDDERARELVDALSDPTVDAVWVARGGSGAARIVQRVVDALRGHPPKILVGFSDTTTLLNALATQLDWVTFHGPVVASLADGGPDTDLGAILETLRGRRRTIPLSKGSPDAAGRLLGGNLTVLASVVGCGVVDRPDRSTIWLLEDVGEPAYKIDRCLTQLIRSEVIEPRDSVWFGSLGTTDDREVIDRLRADLDIRSHGYGAPAGHRGILDVLPIGGDVHLDGRRGLLSETEPWILASNV